MQKHRISFRALYFIALFFLFTPLLNAQLSNLNKRCLWIVRDTMYDAVSIDSAIVHAYNAGYDIVFLQIRGRGYAFYESDIVPKHPNIQKILIL